MSLGNLGRFKKGNKASANNAQSLILMSGHRLKFSHKAAHAFAFVYDTMMDPEVDTTLRLRAADIFLKNVEVKVKMPEEIFNESVIAEAAKHFTLEELKKIKEKESAIDMNL